MLTLLAAQSELAAQVDAATYVGNRRWDIRFKSGEVLALPEGTVATRKALTRFAALNRQNPLLDKGFARFDMRLPGRMTVRVRADAGATPEALREIKI
jgi:cell division protein FtsQ